MERAADRDGIMVWSEVPNWQHISFDKPDVYAKDVTMLKEMIRRDRNKASVILWSGNQANVFLLRRFSSQRIFFNALLFQILTGLVLFAGARSHLSGLPATLVLFFFALLSIGLTYPNAAAIGLVPFSRDAGSASALLGFLQAGTGSLISTGIGVLGPASIISLSSGTALIALLIPIAGRTRIVELIEAPEGEAVSVVH
jgi:DHA1 family bicyclomycin/chloramphenicol resistance-like MFS transporter